MYPARAQSSTVMVDSPERQGSTAPRRRCACDALLGPMLLGGEWLEGEKNLSYCVLRFCTVSVNGCALPSWVNVPAIVVSSAFGLPSNVAR
jgi:hypothetical protein